MWTLLWISNLPQLRPPLRGSFSLAHGSSLNEAASGCFCACLASLQAVDKLPEAQLKEALEGISKTLKAAFEQQVQEGKEHKKLDAAKKEVGSPSSNRAT